MGKGEEEEEYLRNPCAPQTNCAQLPYVRSLSNPRAISQLLKAKRGRLERRRKQRGGGEGLPLCLRPREFPRGKEPATSMDVVENLAGKPFRRRPAERLVCPSVRSVDQTTRPNACPPWTIPLSRYPLLAQGSRLVE